MVTPADKIQLLGSLFAIGLQRGATPRDLAVKTGKELNAVEAALEELVRQGLVEKRGDYLELTKEGRSSIKVVFIGGGFEIIHAGHLHTIEQAKSLGDVLVVVVARDSTIRKRKGREPVSSEEERLRLLSSLRQVDVAILGVEGDIYSTLEKVRPDIVALGYDQHHVEDDIMKEGTKRGLLLRVVRLGSRQPRVKTSRLLTET